MTHSSSCHTSVLTQCISSHTGVLRNLLLAYVTDTCSQPPPSDMINCSVLPSGPLTRNAPLLPWNDAVPRGPLVIRPFSSNVHGFGFIARLSTSIPSETAAGCSRSAQRTWRALCREWTYWLSVSPGTSSTPSPSVLYLLVSQ